jgi:chromosome segregation ATPase
MRRRLQDNTQQLDGLKAKLKGLQSELRQCEREIKAKTAVVKTGTERLAVLESHRDATTANGGTKNTLQIRQHN